MILRKPYAFFIKHFKLMHLILAVLVCFSIYKTKLLLDFYNEYVTLVINVTGQDLVTPLLPFSYQIIPIFVLIFLTIILIVMLVKKKPSLFYFISILIYIFVFVIIQVSKSNLITLSNTLIDSRVTRIIRDLIMLCFFSQIFTIIIISIRAIGFDIKKFDFQTDLRGLEINEEDREEVEIQINYDKNKIIRNIRKKIRFFKYTYKENKLLFNISMGVFSTVIVVIVLSSIFKQEIILKQNDLVYGNNLTLKIIDSYIVNTDFKGNLITNDYYLILRTNIKSNNENSKLDIATTKILIDNYVYTPIIKNKDSIFDFGKVYDNETIGIEYEEKILVYEIPKELIEKDIYFSYVDKNSRTKNGNFKDTKVKIDYIDVTGIESTTKVYLNEKLEFLDTILPDYSIKINAIDIKDEYKLKYNFCVSDECFMSYEYLKPNINSNYDKTLLKISGNIEYEKSIASVYDLFDFISKFGILKYTINNQEKISPIKFSEITSKKTNQNNVYYIEVAKEIKTATNISLLFTIRNKNYEYVLK